MAGLTNEGLEILRLPEVIAEIENSERALISPDVDTDDSKLLGQLNNVFGISLASFWELLQAINSNFNIFDAEGKNLDDLVALLGIRRIPAAASFTPNQLYTAEDGTTIPASVILENPITQDRFAPSNVVEVVTTNCYSALYSVRELLDNTTYTITINGFSYSYTSDGDATELEILNGLEADITADVAATWVAAVDAANLHIDITTTDDVNINISSITYIGPDTVSVQGVTTAVETGDISAPIGVVTGIVVSSGGLISTTNLTAYTLGRDRETDEELRERAQGSGALSGFGTLENIQAALRNTLGVTSAVVFENDDEVVDGEGRSPKSFESVVTGGTDEDIAATIWIAKAVSIKTHGNTTVMTPDSNGTLRTVYFSRPTQLNILVRVTYTLHPEETFPPTGEATIAQTATDFTNALENGEDVVPQRYIGPIFDAVDGIEDLIVEVQQVVSPGDPAVPANWQESRLPVDSFEFARTIVTDVTVIPP